MHQSRSIRMSGNPLRALIASAPVLFGVGAAVASDADLVPPPPHAEYRLTGSAVWAYQPPVPPGSRGIPATTVWAGAPLESSSTRLSGVVHAWALNPSQSQWVYRGRIVGSTPQIGDRFGTAMAGFGSRLLVGAPGRRTTTGSFREWRGAAEVLNFPEPIDSPAIALRTPLLPPIAPPLPGDEYGAAVAMSGYGEGVFAFVGAPGAEVPSGAAASLPDAGTIHVFLKFQDKGWQWTQSLTLSAGQPRDRLGDVLAASESGLFAYVRRPGGAVAFFPRLGVEFMPPTILVAPPVGQPVSGFGEAIAADGRFIVVGAPGTPDAGGSPGYAFVFDAEPPYALRSVISSPFPSACSGFGASIALDQGTLVIGSEHGSEFLSDGMVAAYSLDPQVGTAVLRATFSGPASSGFGAAVATRGGALVACGMPSAGPAGMVGGVRVLSLPQGATADADLDGDGMVDAVDLGILLAAWGSDGSDSGADLDGDGVVGGPDLGRLLARWLALP